ncbi:uncharacterized protein M6B38_365190 [Iris pallida]|uniref:Uncharacterized protein n=1 Tax=Iris pallida TaxID=29817 RepID=A0AAX6GH16_IRIPA|nr:uncharacterized protein M6B38_365190 [Iris pallida]
MAQQILTLPSSSSHCRRSSISSRRAHR